jgi:hypothetical protein
MSIIVRGDFDVELANRAVNKIIERHAVLRTAFVERDGSPKQILKDSIHFSFAYRDLVSMDEDKQKTLVDNMLRDDNAAFFRLEEAEVIRGMIFKLGENIHQVYLNIYHIAFDGWSIGIFVREFSHYYDAFRNGHIKEDESLPYQYIDYTFWLDSQLTQGKLEHRRQYWLNQLTDVRSNITVPPSYTEPETSLQGGIVNFNLRPELTIAIKKLASQVDSSVFMVLLAAYFLFIYDDTYESDLIIGVPFSGRGREEFDSTIGFFVNTLPIRIELGRFETFMDVVVAVRDQCVNGYENAYPINLLVKELNPSRNLSVNALYSTVFNFHNTPMSLHIPGLEIELAEYQINQAKFDFKMDMQEMNEQLTGRMEYRTSRYAPSDIDGFIKSYKRILQSITEHPEMPIISLFDSTNKEVFQTGFGLEKLE